MRVIVNPFHVFPHWAGPLVGVLVMFALDCCLVWLVWSLFFNRFCQVSRGQGLLLRLIALVLAVALPIIEFVSLRNSFRTQPGRFHPGESGILLMYMVVSGIWMLVFAGLPLVVRLYQKWIGGGLTPEEASPGRVGVRAWLRGGNLVMALFVALGGWLGYGWPLFQTFLAVALALLAYPLISTVFQAAPPAVLPPDESTGQRERVLRMLEEGRLTAAEASELLNALGPSNPPPEVTAPNRSSLQRVAFIGAVMVAIGFFLPWFSINPGREAARVLGRMHALIGGAAGPLRNAPVSATGSFHIAGGDIAGGLGWLILTASLGAVVLPLLRLKVDARTQRLLTWTVLGIGGFLLLYLLTQNLRFVSIGSLVVLAGYALEALGMAQEQRQRSPGIS